MLVKVPKHYFTLREYVRIVEAGIFPPDARLALIEGDILEISPAGSRRAACIEFLSGILNRQVRDGFIVSTQDPIRVSDSYEPQPDVALLKFRQDYYRNRHPAPDDVLLVIEVADTTVHYERNVKMPLYARAGIPEALLFNLPDNRLEYFSRPESGMYQENRLLNRGERLNRRTSPGSRSTSKRSSARAPKSPSRYSFASPPSAPQSI